MTPNSDKPINSEEVRCKDCDDCARHAYSDATMPGFFYDKCEKHRKPINSVSPASAIEQLIYGYIEGSGKDNGFHLYAPLSEQVRMKVMLFLQGLYENKRLNDGLREIAKNLQIEMESINSVSPASTKRSNTMQFTQSEAKSLLDFFGDKESNITVVTDEAGSKKAYFTEYPEEGSVDL